MTIGVNLLTCNRTPAHRRATEVCLRSLAESDARAGRLVVVDNGSTDGTAEWLRGFLASGRLAGEVIALPQNVGIAAGRNAAYRRLMDDPAVEVVVEIHNDMIFPRMWFWPLHRTLRDNPDVGMSSARLLTQRGVLGSPRLEIDYGLPYEAIMQLVEDRARVAARFGMRAGLQHPVAKRVAMLRKIGLYDESFTGSNFEDTDEVYRAAAAGWQYVVVGDSIVWHHYVFSRLEVGPDPEASYHANYKRFVEKWPAGRKFLGVYTAQTEGIYR